MVQAARPVHREARCPGLRGGGKLRSMAVSLPTYSPVDDHRYVRPIVVPVPQPRPDQGHSALLKLDPTRSSVA